KTSSIAEGSDVSVHSLKFNLNQPDDQDVYFPLGSNCLYCELSLPLYGPISSGFGAPRPVGNTGNNVILQCAENPPANNNNEERWPS
ncbi:MAG: hypothetical protein VX771_11345, partial [Pseudomonadota bacterium]|nr:hypothetical protein [Pseudomonadota bacterium]